MSVRFAILGAGRIGMVHAQAITSISEASLIAVAEPNESAALVVKQRFGNILRTIDEVALSDDVDAVVICTPTNTHADLIERFSQTKKAIFCEKPIDLNLNRVRQCLKTVRETETTLMVGFNRRFDPDFQSLKATIVSGEIGNIEMVTIISRDPGAPPLDYITQSGGIFRDMTIHDFDMARWILGEEVESVLASGSVMTDPKIQEVRDFDSVNVILRTHSGKQCLISNSRRATYGYDQRIEVLGSKGMVSAGNTHEKNIEISTIKGFKKPPLLNFFMTRYEKAYAIEMAAFVEAILNKRNPPTTGDDGLKALIIAEAALKSVESGKKIQLNDLE